MMSVESHLDWRSTKVFALRVVLVFALTTLAIVTWRISNVILLAFGAVVVAVLLRGIAEFVARHTLVSAGRAVAPIVLVLTLTFGLLGWLIGGEVQAQVADLVSQVPAAWNLLQDRLGVAGLQNLTVDQAGTAFSTAGTVLSPLASVTTAVAGALANIVLVVIGGVFLAARPDLYRRGLLQLVPGEVARARVGATLQASGVALRLWLLGQVVSMIIVGVLTGLGLWLVGVPAPLALAILAFFAEFVPLVGPVIAAVPAMLLALAQGWETGVAALAVYVVVQQVEGYLITPMVQQHWVDLPPALTLFAIVALGVALGPLGLILGAPLLVVLFVAVKKLWVRDTLGQTTSIPGQAAAPS